MMTSRKPIAHGALIVALCLAVTVAWADDDCDAPVQQWQSRDAVMRMAAEQGWKVQHLKIDDGCYELRGRDAQGRAFKAKLDPQTLRLLKMKLHEPERERQRGATPLPSSGSAARGQIE
ncbi:MAG TPA: PepSY domain-containing protein [Burkholderiaceae bacterium]|nr:PepSY domain-containing protein [Burkholderiaceae bacterium]